MGGGTLPYLLQIERETYHADDILEINPIIYITPDTILIYLAEKALNNPNAPLKRKETLSRLYERFATIDIRTLAEWRFFFCEYLNLLSACHRNPALKDKAENFAKVCQVGFPVDSPTNADSELELFHSDFLEVWGSVNRIESVYKNALSFFEGSSGGIKPLGVVVGPLTEKMILAQSTMSVEEKLPLIRLVNSNNICDEDSDDEKNNCQTQLIGLH